MAVEIVPAILAKSREDFEKKLSQVSPYVKRVQIDIMDGKFVPNETLAVEEFPPIPEKLLAEYHLMVEKPLEYVRRIGRRGAIYELHVESFTGAGGKGGAPKREGWKKKLEGAISEIKRMGGRVALAVSPDTPAELLVPFLGKIEHALVMTVYPGFSGQKYLPEMEEKMLLLSKRGAVVEIDGGVDEGNAGSAARAGATLLGVASGIFAKPDAGRAIAELKKQAEGREH